MTGEVFVNSADKDINEIVGRLWLWYQAVSKTRELLAQANRAKLGREQDNTKAELTRYMQGYHRFITQQKGYTKGVPQKSSWVMEYNQITTQTFPTVMECTTIYESCVELAIVYFCQIFSEGFSSEGAAKSNNDSFREEHLNPILASVFPLRAELAKFESLCEELRTARNKMIGHADAESFEITHGDRLSSIKMYYMGWKHIDIDYWRSVLAPLQDAIHAHSIEIENT